MPPPADGGANVLDQLLSYRRGGRCLHPLYGDARRHVSQEIDQPRPHPRTNAGWGHLTPTRSI
jgi:hypothetical protein